MPTLSPSRIFVVAALCGLLASPAAAAARSDGGEDVHADADVTLACLADDATPEAPCGQAQAGVLRWLWELRRRTSVAARPVPVAAAWTPGPPREPILLWLGSHKVEPLAAPARANLVNFLRSGGTLLVDAHDARPDSPFVASVRRTLEGAFGAESIAPVPHDHVLFKSFYLVAAPGGRSEDAAPSYGLWLGGRLAVVLLHHDLFGSLAQEASGAFRHPAGARGERGREMDLRWAINWLMLALCGDYKNDHVHLPFILKRRQ